MDWSSASNLIIGLGVILVGLAYFASQISRGKNSASAETINTYKELLAANSLKVDELTKQVEYLGNKIHVMQGQVEVLTKTNGTLSDIMKDALVMYFEKHPKKAATLEAEVR